MQTGLELSTKLSVSTVPLLGLSALWKYARCHTWLLWQICRFLFSVLGTLGLILNMLSTTEP